MKEMHYYNLTGKVSIVEDFLCLTPTEFVKNKIHKAIERTGKCELHVRIWNLVQGFFVALLVLPLKGAGIFLNRICRKKIDPKTYREEFDDWEERFQHYGTTDNPGPLSSSSIQLINRLIRAKKRAIDCPYNNILFVELHRYKSNNFLAPDGKYPGFITHEADMRLIIGCPTSNKIKKKVLEMLNENHVVPIDEIQGLDPNDSASSNFKRFLAYQLRSGSEIESFGNVKCIWINPLSHKLSASEIKKIMHP